MKCFNYSPDYLHLNRLWKKGVQFLGCSYAILGGAMAWLSERTLVSAISNSGGFGVIAGGALKADQLKKEIQETKRLTSAPFGVNLITFHPDLQALLDVCIEENVSHVFLGGGIPSRTILDFLKQKSIKTICFASSLMIGKRLINLGADALVIEGSEAGGHVGSVSTSVLAQEILPFLSTQIPIFIAGGIATGSAIASYLQMGAAGCQLGTRFVCASESIAHPNFKEAFIRAQSRDAIITPQLDPRFSIIPVRALSNFAMKNFINIQREVIDQFNKNELSKKEAQMKIEFFWSGSLKKAIISGDIENGSLMAGQSVGMVKEIEPCQKIINRLIEEILLFLENNEKSA